MPKNTEKSVKIQKPNMTQGKTIIGKVVSDKMAKTAVVEVVRFITHPLYGKRLRRTMKFHAQNDMGAKSGDNVSICEIRPISKTVNWKVVEVIK